MDLMDYVLDFILWMARAGGVVAIILAVVGFLFREKWKQILQRSLANDIEVLRNELAKNQASHAASLVPELERIKHDFQQKLEAYKVSLIAEVEAVKAREELRKSIALRYAEIEFERLVALERVVASIAANILAMASISVGNKSSVNFDDALEQIRALGAATDEAGMFMSSDDVLLMIDFRKQLLNIVTAHVGSNKPSLADDNGDRKNLIDMASSAHNILKKRILALGTL